MAHSSSASSLNTNMTALEDADDVVVPLNLPKIRIWDIHENSTHYDKMVAAPSDRDMYLMWVFWSLIMAIVAVATGFVGMAVLCDKKARKNPFNVYLLGLMAPDFIMSLLCFMTCWVNAATGYFYSVELCYAQSFYFIFGIAANSWLNSMIARQLYKMLVDAKNCIPFQPPTRKAVLLEIFGVYLYASFVASWGLLDLPWLPHHTQLVLGTACIPMDYDTASTIFFYCVFFPALMGGPLVYVLWVLYKIKRDHVLPTTGKRRILTVYFMRLALVFVLMWLPALVFLFIVVSQVPFSRALFPNNWALLFSHTFRDRLFSCSLPVGSMGTSLGCVGRWGLVSFAGAGLHDLVSHETRCRRCDTTFCQMPEPMSHSFQGWKAPHKSSEVIHDDYVLFSLEYSTDA